jgi:hypothetical protein
MEKPRNIDELPCDLMVNGVPFQSVQIHCFSNSADHFQLVIAHPILGAFALHSEFELGIREEGSTWRPVTLEQLKKTLIESSEFLRAKDLPKSSETVERKRFDRLDDIDIPHRKSPRLSKLTGHDECVREVQKILREARVPHQVAGTVFVVPSAFRTRICLLREGFRKSTISPAALVEPRSGCAIQLVERRI